MRLLIHLPVPVAQLPTLCGVDSTPVLENAENPLGPVAYPRSLIDEDLGDSRVCAYGPRAAGDPARQFGSPGVSPCDKFPAVALLPSCGFDLC